MSDTWDKIVQLIRRGDIKISEHGYDELAAYDISVREIVIGSDDSIILEEYPEYGKGPCVLVMQNDRQKRPIHVVWGIPRGLFIITGCFSNILPTRSGILDGWF